MDPDGNSVITKVEFLAFFKDISLCYPEDDGFVNFVRSMWRRRR